jgi:hypothetical protein
VEKALYGWIVQLYSVLRYSVLHLVFFSVLAALCIGIQLTPRPPNVEFTSLIVFVTGAVFGITFGAGLGVLVMFINGFASPYGVAGIILPFQIIGMVVVGVGGGLYGRSRHGCYDAQSCAEAAVLGAFLTLAYDAITNFGFAVTYMMIGEPVLLAFVSAIVSGAVFSVIHIVSNTVFFGAAFLPITSALQKLLGGEQIWKREFSPT